MRRALTLVTVMLFGGGCGGESTTTPPTPTPPAVTPVASLTVTPPTAQLLAQQSVQLDATVKDAAGGILSGRAIAWSASPAGRVTVSSSGLVTATAAGSATVTATSEGKSASATIAVGESAIIGAAGGTVNAAGGNVQLVFPAQAVTGNTPITVAPLLNSPSNAMTVGSTAYEFGPSGTFANQIDVAIKYDPSTLPAGTDESRLRLYTLVSGKWTFSPLSWVDTTANTVHGFTNHFSGWITCGFPCAIDVPEIAWDTHGYRYVDIKKGATASLPISYFTQNFSGPVTFTMENAPAGLTMATGQGPFPNAPNLIFSASSAVPVGTHTVRVVARSAGVADAPAELYIVVSAPGFGVTVAPSTIPVVQGTSATANLSIVRDGVAGAITFSTTSLPTGVTASFAPTTVSGNSTVMTITASAGAPVGNYNNVMVKGSVNGLPDVLTPIAITVVSSSGFALTGTPPFVNLVPGGTGSTGVKATRVAGFTAAIVYTVTGLPAGLTATTTTTSTTDSMRVAFTASGALATGTYTVTVTGTSGNKVESTSILVTVGSPGTVTVQLDITKCITNGKTAWVATQDGSAPFVVRTGASGLYSFPITAGKGAYVVVVTDGANHRTAVNFGTPAELQASPTCTTESGPPPSKTLNFTVTGMLPFETTDLTVGGNYIPFQYALPTFTSNTIPEGPLDFVLWRYLLPTPSSARGLIRRDQTFANNGNVTFDMSDAGTFAAVSASATISSGASWGMGYYTGVGCKNYSNLGSQLRTFTGTILGVPTSAQQPTDLHVLGTGISTPQTLRTAEHLFHTMASQSVALGAPAPTPTVTPLGGPYRRVQVAFSLPPEYAVASYTYSDAVNSVTLQGNTGYFASGAVTMVMPDLSAIASPTWFPSSASTGNARLSLSSAANYPCSDGATYRTAHVFGTN